MAVLPKAERIRQEHDMFAPRLRRSSAVLIAAIVAAGPVRAQDDPELIFRKDTVWRALSPNAKLATYVIDDPQIDGVSCYFTVPEVGGWKGWAGFAEEKSDVSLACRQTGAVNIKEKFEQGEEIYRQRRSLFFKRMRIVRGCDQKRNVLVYLTYSDRIIEGSPQNSTSTVPIMPWANSAAPKCGDFLK
jgi:CreA protein